MEPADSRRIYVGKMQPPKHLISRWSSQASSSTIDHSDKPGSAKLKANGAFALKRNLKITVGAVPPIKPIAAAKIPPKITVGTVPPGFLSRKVPPKDFVRKGSRLSAEFEAAVSSEAQTLRSRDSLDLSNESEIMRLMSAESITVFHADRLSSSPLNSSLENAERLSSNGCNTAEESEDLKPHLELLSTSSDSVSTFLINEAENVNEEADGVTPPLDKQPSAKEETLQDEAEEPKPEKQDNEESTAEKVDNTLSTDDSYGIKDSGATQKDEAPKEAPKDELAEQEQKEATKADDTFDNGEQRADTSSKKATDKLKRIRNKLQAIIHMSNLKSDLDKSNSGQYGYELYKSHSFSSDFSSLNQVSGGASATKLRREPSNGGTNQATPLPHGHSISRRANLRMHAIEQKYNRITEQMHKLKSDLKPNATVNRYTRLAHQEPMLCYKEGIAAMTRRDDLEYMSSNFPTLYKLFSKRQGSLTQGSL